MLSPGGQKVGWNRVGFNRLDLLNAERIVTVLLNKSMKLI